MGFSSPSEKYVFMLATVLINIIPLVLRRGGEVNYGWKNWTTKGAEYGKGDRTIPTKTC